MNENQPANPLAQVHETLEQMETLAPESVFGFKCHGGLACWGECCKNPNLFLTPYDILRLRKSVNIPSGEFLARYTEAYVGPDFGLPVVRMKQDENGGCPFLSDAGCGVYENRPTSCRTYPVGQAVSSGTGKGDSQKAFFKVKEDYCLGWNSEDEWTVEKWLENQDVFEYNKNNEFSVHLSFHPSLGDPKDMDEKTVDMIFMAQYDLDRFREFVFKSSFLKRFDLDEELVQRAGEDDETLLDLGRRWISFFALGGLAALEIREG